MKNQVNFLQNKKSYIVVLCGLLPFYLNDIYFPYVGASALFWVLDFAQFVVIPFFVISILLKEKLITGAELGFTYVIEADRGIIYNIFAFCVCIVLIPILSVLIFLLGDSWIIEPLFPVNFFQNSFAYGALIPEQGLLKWVIVLYYSFSAGIVEELYYRSLLYNVAKKIFKQENFKILFLLISSLLFGLAHFGDGIINICGTFLIGLFWGSFYLYSRNIIVLITSHIFVNFIILGLMQ